MDKKHLNRVVAAAMGAATIGAVALPAAEASADAATTLNLNWGALNLNPVSADDGPFFAEYHQGEYVRAFDQLSNWGIWNKNVAVVGR